MNTNQSGTGMVDLTESETHQVAGGAGHAYGKLARELEEPAWFINGGKAKDAPGHNKS